MNLVKSSSHLLFLFFLYGVFCVSIITAGFTGETLVKTSKDSFVKIKDLKADDKVVCLKPGYKTLANQKINGIQKKQVNSLVKITIKDGNVIYTTPDHKFYLGKEKQWCIVENLSVGHELLQLDMKHSIIEKIEKVTTAADIFSMSIHKWHNFGVTKNAILVHNEAVTLTLATIAFGVGEGAVITIAAPAAIGGFIGAIAAELLFPGTFGKIMGGLFHKNSDTNTPHQNSQNTNQEISYSPDATFYVATDQNSQIPPLHPDYEKFKDNGIGGDQHEITLTFPAFEPEKLDFDEDPLKPYKNPIIFNTKNNPEDGGASVNPTPEAEKKPPKKGKRPPKTVQDIIGESEPGEKTGGPSTIHSRPGGFDRANEDFDDLGLSDVVDKGNGMRTGTLPNGDTVIVRPGSSGTKIPFGKPLGDGEPTLEVQERDPETGKVTGKKIKIRYLSFKFQSIVETLNTYYKENSLVEKGRIDVKLTMKKSLDKFNDTAKKIIFVNGKIITLPNKQGFKREDLENLNKMLLFSGFYNNHKIPPFRVIDNQIIWLPKQISYDEFFKYKKTNLNGKETALKNGKFASWVKKMEEEQKKSTASNSSKNTNFQSKINNNISGNNDSKQKLNMDFKKPDFKTPEYKKPDLNPKKTPEKNKKEQNNPSSPSNNDDNIFIKVSEGMKAVHDIAVAFGPTEKEREEMHSFEQAKIYVDNEFKKTGIYLNPEDVKLLDDVLLQLGIKVTNNRRLALQREYAVRLLVLPEVAKSLGFLKEFKKISNNKNVIKNLADVVDSALRNRNIQFAKDSYVNNTEENKYVENSSFIKRMWLKGIIRPANLLREDIRSSMFDDTEENLKRRETEWDERVKKEEKERLEKEKKERLEQERKNREQEKLLLKLQQKVQSRLYILLRQINPEIKESMNNRMIKFGNFISEEKFMESYEKLYTSEGDGYILSSSTKVQGLDKN